MVAGVCCLPNGIWDQWICLLQWVSRMSGWRIGGGKVSISGPMWSWMDTKIQDASLVSSQGQLSRHSGMATTSPLTPLFSLPEYDSEAVRQWWGSGRCAGFIATSISSSGCTLKFKNARKLFNTKFYFARSKSKESVTSNLNIYFWAIYHVFFSMFLVLLLAIPKKRLILNDFDLKL